MINRLVFYIVKQTRWESKGIVKMSIADLVKHSDSYLELFNKFSEQINFINSKAEVPSAGFETLQSIKDNGKKLCNDYSFVRNELLEIYKRLGKFRLYIFL